eukprot:jgi/Botrbrau1/6956/Bobra.0215s0033.1
MAVPQAVGVRPRTSEEQYNNMRSEDFGLALMRIGACLGVLIGHCVLCIGLTDPERFYKILDEVPWVLVIMNIPEVVVDIFIILTGFLATVALVPAFETANNRLPIILRYYQKRASKLLPNYYCTLLWTLIALYPFKHSRFISEEVRTGFFSWQPYHPEMCKDALWANFVFAQNQFPFGGCSTFLWTLAVQIQFYLLLPVLLLLLQPSRKNFRWRILWICAVPFISQAVRRIRIVWHPDMYMPIPWFGPFTPEAQKLQLLMGYEYFNLLPRLTTLACGVVAALIYIDPRLLESFKRHRRAVRYMLSLMMVNFVLVFLTNKFGPESRPEYWIANKWVLFAGFVGHVTIIQPSAVTLAILYVASDPWKPPKAVAAAISWMSEQTYDIFLVHVFVLIGLFTVFPPSKWFFSAPTPPFGAYMGFTALALALSILVGYLQRAMCSVFVLGFRLTLAMCRTRKTKTK